MNKSRMILELFFKEELEKRNIWFPYMKVSSLNRLLLKPELTEKDYERLKDFLYYLITYPEDGLEKGFYIGVADTTASAGSYTIANKFWLTNIKTRIQEYENKLKNKDK